MKTHIHGTWSAINDMVVYETRLLDFEKPTDLEYWLTEQSICVARDENEDGRIDDASDAKPL